MSLNALAASEVTQGIAQGKFSAAQVLDASIARIEAANARVNAFTAMHLERARNQAQTIDGWRATGKPLPPLAGVPFAVKNMFDVQGEVTLAGSVVNRTNPAAASDAFLIQRMCAAGAVLVGSLNMDEFAYGFTTENTHYGANGSIRVPASLCGVWGVKPTFGRLSRRGTYPFVESIDHLGGFANSLEGLATLYDALQGPDARDPGCHAKKLEPVSPVLSLGAEGLRIGVLTGFFEENASPQALEVVDLAARQLGNVARVEWPDAGLARMAAFIVTASEGGALHLNHLRTQIEDMEPLSVDRFMAGAILPAAWYIKAQRFRRMYRDKVNTLFESWDVLIAPATPVSAPTIGTEWLDIQGQRLPSRASMGMLTQPVSFAGCPVVAAPLWPTSSHGMPLGIQIIAAPWREDLAFRVARALESSGVCRLKKVGF